MSTWDNLVSQDELDDVEHEFELSGLLLRRWFSLLKKHENQIFVRRFVANRWQDVALSTLHPEDWADTICDWLDRGYLPAIVKEDDGDGKPESTTT